VSHARRAKTRLRITHEAAKTEAGYVLREIDKLKLGIAPEKAAEEASTEKSLLHPLLQASAGDSKAPATPTEIVSAAEASSRAGDGGRTRDPRLGNRRQLHPPRLHTSKPSQPFRVLRHIPTRRDAVDTGGRGAAGPPRDPGRASWVCPPPRRRSSPFARWRADSACAL